MIAGIPVRTVQVSRLLGVLACFGLLACSRGGRGDESPHPLSAEERQRLQESLHQEIEAASTAIDSHPDSVELYGRRGDARFFAGRFAEALNDYDRMVMLDPSQDASHWRRGIACFFAGRYEQGAAQFTRYHSFDNVDRENGIWRYLCQYRANGREAARAELLKYDKDDREPFGDLYRLFAGELSADEILRGIRSRNLPEVERGKQLFYAELYIGLNEFVEGRQESARVHLRAATVNRWASRSGYGPNYMWHVGRLQYDLLDRSQEPAALPETAPDR